VGGSYYESTHQDSYEEFKRSHGPAVERVRKCKNQEDIEGGEEDPGPKRKFRKE